MPRPPKLVLPTEIMSQAELDDDPTWAQRGACVGIDPDLFFPERGESTIEAKRVCMTCEVRPQCESYGVRNECYGTWGGRSARNLKDIRRALGLNLGDSDQRLAKKALMRSIAHEREISA